MFLLKKTFYNHKKVTILFILSFYFYFNSFIDFLFLYLSFFYFKSFKQETWEAFLLNINALNVLFFCISAINNTVNRK